MNWNEVYQRMLGAYPQFGSIKYLTARRGTAAHYFANEVEAILFLRETIPALTTFSTEETVQQALDLQKGIIVSIMDGCPFYGFEWSYTERSNYAERG